MCLLNTALSHKQQSVKPCQWYKWFMKPSNEIVYGSAHYLRGKVLNNAPS